MTKVEYLSFIPDDGWLPIDSIAMDGREVDLWVLNVETGEGYRVADCRWHQAQEKWKASNYTANGYNKLGKHEPVYYRLRPEPPAGEEKSSVVYRKYNHTYHKKVEE